MTDKATGKRESGEPRKKTHDPIRSSFGITLTDRDGFFYVHRYKPGENVRDLVYASANRQLADHWFEVFVNRAKFPQLIMGEQ